MGKFDLRIWVRRLRRPSAVAAAVMVMLGACLAGTAEAQSGPNAYRGTGSMSAPSATTNSKECFYSAPSCSSSDPNVTFSHHSDGDTSGCVFKETVNWGDKSRTTKSFSGGPNGATVVTFDHRYTAKPPHKYNLVDTITETSGDCGIFGTAFRYFTLDYPSSCLAGTQPSGPAWVSKYPYSDSLNGLAQPFRGDVIRFIDAMTQAGIKEKTVQTFRPAQRAYLMHYSWLIAHHQITPQKVPAFPAGKPDAKNPYPGTVDICWAHLTSTGEVDLTASIKAATQMAVAYGIDSRYKHAPAYPTEHSVGDAIDMTTVWTANKIAIVNAHGEKVTISTSPHSGLNRQLIAVGATYHVIHFKNVAADPNHWSVNGK
jgi:hypothetical protein